MMKREGIQEAASNLVFDRALLCWLLGDGVEERMDGGPTTKALELSQGATENQTDSEDKEIWTISLTWITWLESAEKW